MVVFEFLSSGSASFPQNVVYSTVYEVLPEVLGIRVLRVKNWSARGLLSIGFVDMVMVGNSGLPGPGGVTGWFRTGWALRV